MKDSAILISYVTVASYKYSKSNLRNRQGKLLKKLLIESTTL